MNLSRSSLSSLALAFAALGSVTLLVVACGSKSDSTFGNDAGSSSGSSNGGFDDASIFGDGASPDAGDPYANDPPPTYCVGAGQPTPPEPGGTAMCPDDKNLPGCGCTMEGQMAPCWTGLRVNRDLGQCKDGTTTCEMLTETSMGWGPCVGEVLPTAGQTKGKEACKCFSGGQWAIANASPCFITFSDSSVYATSSTQGTGGSVTCTTTSTSPPPAVPTADWSTDTLNVDCAGHFKLCYELKAGDYSNPQPTDCSLAKVCTEADYTVANAVQTFPDLPAWASADAACAAKWNASGGYGEMSVLGESVLCDKVDDGSGNSYVFNRVQYCPSVCNGPNPPAAQCASCQQGGSGSF